MAHILVVDDDHNILEVIRTRLEVSGHTVETYPDPLEALDRLKERVFDVIITDVRMPKIDGMDFLNRVRRLGWDVPVILLTAYGTIPSAVEAIKRGAFEYLTKPFQGKQLLQVVQAAIEEHGRFQQASNGMHFPGVFGTSPKMQALFQILERIIRSDSMVLLHGESGTGKELIAQMIHHNGSRRNNRFVVMDCGATPGSLIESELFGHAKGSFTHATESRKGLFEIADKGTLFLDEISSMRLDLQTRLLRGLQEGQIKRVGENIMREVDVRVIAATNQDLREQVRKGLFRLDLYYRLAVLHIELPPLRERRDDVPLLAQYFLETFSRKMKKERMQFGAEALNALCEYPWPGNIRELKNVIEAAIVLAPGQVLEVDDLVLAGFSSPFSPTGLSMRDEPPDLSGVPLPKYLEQQERELILKALRENNWVQKDAARQLGVSARVLCYKIKKMRIEPPTGPEPEPSQPQGEPVPVA